MFYLEGDNIRRCTMAFIPEPSVYHSDHFSFVNLLTEEELMYKLGDDRGLKEGPRPSDEENKPF